MNGLRMRRLTRVAVLAALVAVPAGCGSDDKSSSKAPAASSSGASGNTGAGGADQSAPTGSLSQQEYRLFRGAFTEANRADKESGTRKGLAHVRKACSIMGRGSTSLTDTAARDCQASYDFFVEILAFPKRAQQCQEQPGQEISSASSNFVSYAPSSPVSSRSCASQSLKALAKKTRTAVEKATATNSVLAERRIRGRCASAIGTAKRDLRNGSRIATTADEFDQALQDGKPAGVRRATKNFQDALTAFSQGTSPDLVKLLRSCPH
jgi:hypothetical protein